MAFRVVGLSEPMPKAGVSEIVLVTDKWDDWAKFRTQFHLWVFDHRGSLHDIGEVKIGQKGLRPGPSVSPGVRAPELASSFEELPDDKFSLGQSETYYESLNELPEDLKALILIGLRDLAFNIDIFDAVVDEQVTKESLLRHVQASNVRNRFHRLSKGDATLTRYQFSCKLDTALPSERGILDFSVEPHSQPPTNVHVLIGRNGVGKSHNMQRIATALVSDLEESSELVEARGISPLGEGWSFSSLVLVSFSAFDEFDLPQPRGRIDISYVGLRTNKGPGKGKPKSPHDLLRDFISSLAVCRAGIRANRWKDAVSMLSSDPVFHDASPLDLIRLPNDQWEQSATRLFKKLSSGHKIVLLTISRLVECVAEKSLVLIDEPESHLHPPLLSAFVRSVSQLLIQRNGVAIVATHSPVVLQEVPRSCTWVINRFGNAAYAERPQLETFGENIGILTREVFGLEVTESGFHKIIRTAVRNSNDSYERILDRFGGQIGAEGRAIVRSLIALRETGKLS